MLQNINAIRADKKITKNILKSPSQYPKIKTSWMSPNPNACLFVNTQVNKKIKDKYPVPIISPSI